MKYLLTLLAGLLAGALLTATALGAIAARERYPRSVMVVMQANLTALQRGLRDRDCGLPESRHHFGQLVALGAEIPRAFAARERDSAEFRRSRELFEAALDAADTAPPADCAALNRAITAVGQSCEACHARFR
jgi:hypothetical protein